MTELNLTDYERGFLVAKSDDIVKSFKQLANIHRKRGGCYEGDDWYSVTVIDVVHGRKDVEYDLNIWDDDDGKMCCTAYAVTVSDNPYKVQTDDSTFTRLW